MTRRAHNSRLAAPTKPIACKTRLRNRGGSMFPKRRDRKYTEWIKTLPCVLFAKLAHVCQGPIDPCHVFKTRACGAYDRGEVVPGGDAMTLEEKMSELYDGSYVENHCTQCEEYESECVCEDDPTTPHTIDTAREKHDEGCLGTPRNRVQIARVLLALTHLRQARELLKKAEAPKATGKVRLAISSTEGALRHAELAPYRATRQQPDESLANR